MANNKIAYKYIFKIFYRQTNKKKYKLQILIISIYYIKVIVIQDVILIAKIWNESKKKN